MKPIKKIIFSLILMVFFLTQAQEKNKPSASSPEMGSTSKTTHNRLATTVEPDRKFSYAERELDYLLHIWKGEYDNVEQLDFDKIQLKEGQSKPHDRVHTSVWQFKNANFGEGAVYIEEYRNDDPSLITRQCVYQLLPDDAEKAIRVKVFHFKKRMPILAAGNSIDKIENLNPKSKELEAGCDLMLRRNGNGFLAKTLDKTCNKSADAKELSIDYQISITETSFGYQEVLYASGQRMPDAEQVSAFEMEKARCFSCMIDFPNDTNGRPTVTKFYIEIFDQGGAFDFEYIDGRQMHFGMRNTWSFGMHRETFVIYLVDKATQKTLVYSWGNPGADRIGFNPGWIRAQCDLKTARNIKMQKELRPGS